MAGFIGLRGMAALERIGAALDLDYGGIDFAVNGEGDILFFEGNVTMVMAPLAADEKWAYRRPAFDAVFAAIRAMLLDRARRDSLATAWGVSLPRLVPPNLLVAAAPRSCLAGRRKKRDYSCWFGVYLENPG
jgi:hypothetical protein